MNAAFAVSVEDGDLHSIAASLINDCGADGVSVSADLRERVDGMMASMNYIILLVIICAGALAFIVLFNLGNINITERVREIATIKVLGFYPGETGAYVLRSYRDGHGVWYYSGNRAAQVRYGADKDRYGQLCREDTAAELSLCGSAYVCILDRGRSYNAPQAFTDKHDGITQIGGVIFQIRQYIGIRG